MTATSGARGACALLAIAIVCLLCGPADAAAHPCARVIEPAERLACYDRTFPPAPEVREAEAGRAQREFGLEQKAPPLRGAEAAPELDRVESRIEGIGYESSGSRVLTLDNGQKWVLTEAASRGHLVVGDAVQIRKAALGSYMLITPAGVPLRARRLR